MVDTISSEQRSRNMSRIRSRDTKPELVVRSMLHRAGFRFRLNVKKLPGKPDIVLPKYKIIIFVHGCFWHQHPGCKRQLIPSSRKEYWEPKLKKNTERDKLHLLSLKELGWRVGVIWECDTTSPVVLSNKLSNLFPMQIPSNMLLHGKKCL